MTYSYKEFPQDVLTAFVQLIETYRLTVEIEEDNLVELGNEHVVLKFMFDRGEFFAELRKDGDDTTFALWEIINYLVPNAWKKKKSKDYPGGLLRFYAELFSNELNPILLGDDHWYEGLKEAKLYESSLIRAVRQLDFHHPIYQKFSKLDKSWKADMETYIKQHNIQLKHPKKEK